MIALVPFLVIAAVPHFAKRALLVGAWDYSSRVWPKLSSNDDVALLKATLESRFGWVPARGGKIEVLTSRAETTRQSILSHFKSFLATDVRAGDTLYFHYSGHGYQAPDVDPRRYAAVKAQAPVNPLVGNSPGGLDDTLLPTDDPDRNANQIRDEEVGLLVKGILDAAKSGSVNVFVTIDACHSGGATRGISRVVRGRAYDGPIPRTTALYDPKSPEAVFLRRVSGYTFMSACRSDQEAGQAVGPDHKTYGRFTLALCEAMNRCTESTSYRELFDLVDGTMASHWTFGAVDQYSQNPQLQGEADRTLFGSSALATDGAFSLLPTGSGHYRLKAGMLQGVTEGSVLDLYAEGRKKRVAVLTVRSVGLIDSAFVSQPPLSEVSAASLSGARAVLVSQGPAIPVPSIDASSIRTHPLFARIAEALRRRVPAVRLSADPSTAATLKIESDSAGFHIFRTANAAEVMATGSGATSPIPADDAAPIAIADRIFEELRFQAVAQVSNDFVGQKQFVEIQAVPCETRDLANGETDWVRDLPSPKEGWVVGTRYTVKLRLHGSWEPYIALLDLTSDGHIGMLWPLAELYGNSVQIESLNKGGWVRLNLPNTDRAAVFVTTPPTGKEILKLVASERPLPFRDLLSSDERGAAVKSPLGHIFGDYLSVTTRSPVTAEEPGEIWSTRQVTLTIRDKGR